MTNLSGGQQQQQLLSCD